MKRKDWRLSGDERNDARAALKILDGTGISLESAARLALRLGDSRSQKTGLSRAVDDFLRACLRRKVRPRTYQYYESHLLICADTFAGRTLDDFDRPALKQYLESLPNAPGTIDARFRALRALFRWARRQDPPLVARDPTEGLQLDLAAPEHRIDILTPAETAGIMTGLPARFRAPAALLLFAGIRPGELRSDDKPPLLWRHIDVSAGIIRIPAEIAKVRRPRLLEDLPANLWRWITSGPPDTPVSPTLSVEIVRHMQRILRARPEDPRTAWPQNACRHSFASYHLAMHSDPGRTATLLGHEGNPTILYRHYRGLATKAQAAEYFAITPEDA